MKKTFALSPLQTRILIDCLDSQQEDLYINQVKIKITDEGRIKRALSYIEKK